jgi:7beta-hydroxy-3-oxochol-24-oyl-CoA 4-desaturase
MQELNRLFSPFHIGKMTLRNRLVMAPMDTAFANDDNTLSSQLLEFYTARAKGGVGLVVLPSITVDAKVPFARNLVLWHDRYISDFHKLAEMFHSYDVKVIPELCHPGPGFTRLTELTVAQIQVIIGQFVEAARRAKEAGCDGVEIHAAHAFMLVGSFISALRNGRTDAYGGAIENRIKLPCDIIRSIHNAVGWDFPVLVRISTDELVPGGRNIRETQYIAPLLEAAGADALDLSVGIAGDWQNAPPTGSHYAINVSFARAIKERVNVPVMVVGRINDARLAEDILARNEADLIVMARALVADPELPVKSAAGTFEDIIPCIGCRICMAPNISPKKCTVNPTFGREGFAKLIPTARPKKILIAGGGPGGIQAAITASLRGHEVTLCEKQAVMGGRFNLAIAPPLKQEISKAIQYLLVQLTKSPVKVLYNTEVIPQLVAEMQPDSVIVATGARPLLPLIPGITGERVVTADDVLSYKATVKPGNVLVLGGGMVGCETADFIANPGYMRPSNRTMVTILEMQTEIALDMEGANRVLLLQRLHDKEVKILTSARVTELLPDGAVFNRIGNAESLHDFDTIVLAMGAVPDDQLSGEIKKSVPEVYVIGDAKEPRKALEAIAEGWETGSII